MSDPLTSATVALHRGVLSDREATSNAPLDALPHVVALVSSYLDGAIPSRWTMERAIESGFGLRMLKRLAGHEAAPEATGSRPPIDPFYRAFLASKALVAEVKSGDDSVDVVRWICCEYCPSVVPVKATIEAARSGRLRVLQWLFEKYPSLRVPRAFVDEALLSGHLHVIQWLMSQASWSPQYYLQCISIAALRGHKELVQWLHEELRRVLATSSLSGQNQQASLPLELDVQLLITHGHFETVKFLATAGCNFVTERGSSSLETREEANARQLRLKAREGLCHIRGDVETLQWLHNRGLTRPTDAWMESEARAGHLDIVEWIHGRFSDATSASRAMDGAAANGHLDILQWLHEHRSERCTTNAMDYAAANGHFEVVKWLHEHRSEGCTIRAMDSAANRGYIAIVQWLHENRTEGCSTVAMDYAASQGHLKVVQWLHENRREGCTTGAMNFAAANGHVEVVQWLHEHRSEGCTTAAMDSATANGHLEVVKYLYLNRSEGCTVGAMDYVASNGHLEIVTWLHEHQAAGCTASAMDWAAKHRHLEVVQYLHENRSEGCTVDAMDDTNSMRVLAWLHAHRSEGCSDYATVNAVGDGNFDKLLFLHEKQLVVCTDDVVRKAVGHDNFEIFQWLRGKYPEWVDMEAIDASQAVGSREWQLFVGFEAA